MVIRTAAAAAGARNRGILLLAGRRSGRMAAAAAAATDGRTVRCDCRCPNTSHHRHRPSSSPIRGIRAARRSRRGSPTVPPGGEVRLFSGGTNNHNKSSSGSSSNNRCFRLGDLRLRSSAILAPLERVSDVGFRRVCFERGGAALTWTEMVYGSELVHPVGGGGGGGNFANRQHTSSSSSDLRLEEARRNPRGGRGANLIDTHDPNTPTGVQLLVDRCAARDDHGADLLRRCLEQLEAGAASDDFAHWRHIVAVDLNLGCPAPSVSRRGAGPAQLRRRSKIRRLFEILAEWKRRARSSSLPRLGAVGAKIRLGNTAREREFKVYLPAAEAAAEAGLDYLAVHARHGDQRSRDPVSWECIGEIQDLIGNSSRCRVIGNGDVRTAADARALVAQTGCAGVMIGRAAMRNPWCFRRLAEAATSDDDDDADGDSTSEWPTPAQVREAAALNRAWSRGRPAEVRYRRIRDENWARLARQARAAHPQPQDGRPPSGAANRGEEEEEQRGPDGDSPSSPPPSSSPHSDWYLEWSRASTRRRHLDRLDDEGEHRPTATAPPARGSDRRTCNPRDWKERKKRRRRRRKQNQPKAAVIPHL